MKLSRKQKKRLLRIIISLAAFIILISIDLTIGLDSPFKGNPYAWLLPFSLYLVLYLYIGYDVIIKAFKNIIRGHALDENFLMVIATVGAFSIKEFSEGVAVLLFYQVGEFFQDYAVGKSRKSVSSLMDIRPDYANLKKEDGSYEQVDPNIVKVDDIILVKPGEKIPLDGIVLEGDSSLDTKALTGESLPREVSKGDSVISGTININGVLTIKVLKAFHDSTVSKILDLVENAASQKSKSENFITKFARIYTPAVVISAVLLIVIGGWVSGDWVTWLSRGLSFLVISCPCALVISVPLSFFAGIGGASKYGVLIKGSTYIEQFNKADIFVFDKTGTLTKGNFAIAKIEPEEKKDEILHLAAIAENNSNHPIANSIKKAYGKKVDESFTLTDVSGKGIIASKDKDSILCGNEKLMKDNSIDYVPSSDAGTIVYVAKNNKYIGYIVIADEIKDGALPLINYLNKEKYRSVMLTGDNDRIASSVANKLGLSEYKSSLLPQQKVEQVDKLLSSKGEKDILCFVGDGINDAPVLMKSDIGIAMGGVGSDAAIEASDIVLMRDDLKSIIIAKKVCKKTMRLVYENISFALFVKLLVLILSGLGYANMWMAILADVGVAIICILNAMRANCKYTSD